MKEIQDRIKEIRAFYSEDYQEDNIVILQERLKQTLRFMSEIIPLETKAKTIHSAKLNDLLRIYTPTRAKAMASTEKNLLDEIKSIKSLNNQSHRALITQISAWKEEHAAYRTGGGNIT